MTIPPSSHPGWQLIIYDKQDIEFDFFVTKILLGRLNSQVRLNPSTIDACVDELHKFFERHAKNPKVISDLHKIFV